MNSEKEDIIYLYCLTGKAPGLPPLDIEVYSISCFGLYAVLSKVSADEFSEENLRKNLTDLEWVKHKAVIHEKVIETVMKESCLPAGQAGVLPFKFGIIFNTEESLKKMLKERVNEFKDALKYLEGKEEWGGKIYCDVAKLKESLAREDKELLNMDKEINSCQSGKAFILKKKKVELLNIMVNKKLNSYGQHIFERLGQFSVEARVNKLLPKEATGRKEDMILNFAFLIEKNKVESFIVAQRALKAIFEEMGFFFDCSGPWPPYNFCETQAYGVKCAMKSQSDF
ncbi:MAG: GvpL/GvpF family gas vesicle protein [Candidatus Omnitrophota bacterium]